MRYTFWILSDPTGQQGMTVYSKVSFDELTRLMFNIQYGTLQKHVIFLFKNPSAKHVREHIISNIMVPTIR